MSKTKISEFSSDPALNTDIDGINIAEGCAPSGINNAIRELMAQLKDWQSGTSLDTFNTNYMVATAVDINGGAIDGAVIGGASAAAGTFTTATATTFNATTVDSTNLEVTNLKAKDGTAAGSIADSTGVVSITANPILSGGTANGVAYLNGSKVLTTGSALTFDGTTLGTNKLTTTGFATLGLGAVFTGASNNATGVGVEIGYSSGASSGYVQAFNRTSSAYAPIYYDASVQSWNISGSEQMRLTSTGLGIGTSSPQEKLTVAGAVQVTGVLSSLNRPSSAVVDFLSGQTRFFSIGANSSTYGGYSFRIATTTANTEAMTLDSSGNLGLGVTPSAWLAGSQAIQNSSGALWQYGGGNVYLGQNYYLNGSVQRIYSTTAGATEYNQAGGAHRWYTAPSGTAGNAITFTQALTLTANRNLLLETTSENAGNGGLKVNGQFALAASQAFTSSGAVNNSAYYIVCYSLSGTCTLTLPTPANNTGRILNIVVQSNQQVVSASSNVTKITDGSLTTAILPATAGKWAQLWCDGTYWNIISTNV